jgi:ADP-ribose pyrophosphatase YjhB (NUDIX family)
MRRYPDRPVVGVGAVIVDGDRVLLVRRGHPPLKGEWSLPGGAVELGETLEAALKREILEETRLDVNVECLVDVVDRVHRGPDGRVEYHYVVVDYLCTSRSNAVAAGSDADDVMWVARAELPVYRVAETAIQVIDKALELSLTRP